MNRLLFVLLLWTSLAFAHEHDTDHEWNHDSSDHEWNHDDEPDHEWDHGDDGHEPPPDDGHEPPPDDGHDDPPPPDDPPDEPPPPDDPPDNEPPLPPAGGFAVIPGVPFDYQATADAVTQSGPLPSSLGAGEAIALQATSMSTDRSFSCNGTAEQPAFVLGGSISGSNDVLRINGSYCYFVGTVFVGIQPRTSGDHIVLRDIEVRNVPGKNGLSLSGRNVVLTGSEIHHNQGDDRHGIFVGPGSNGVWILGNDVHHNGGDGFQACHGCSANPPRNVYIGGNLFHSDRENAIDFKYIQNVVVEKNVIHSLVRAPKDQEWCFDDGSGCGVFSSGSDGSAIVIGSDGGPTNVQVVDNDIFNTINAVRIEEGYEVSIVGNDFRDIEERCLQLDKDGPGTVYSGNSCTNAGRGIFQNWRENFANAVISDNTFDTSGPDVEFESGSLCNSWTLTGNAFQSPASVICGSNQQSTEAGINGLSGASGNIVN